VGSSKAAGKEDREVEKKMASLLRVFGSTPSQRRVEPSPFAAGSPGHFRTVRSHRRCPHAPRLSMQRQQGYREPPLPNTVALCRATSRLRRWWRTPLSCHVAPPSASAAVVSSPSISGGDPGMGPFPSQLLQICPTVSSVGSVLC
jgi:hypothetical protein